MLIVLETWKYMDFRDDYRRKFLKPQRSFLAGKCFLLTNQVRRSSRSVGAQIAEAWAKRKYKKHFISKLTDADGEQLETQHWIEIALDSSYIQNDLAIRLLEQYQSIGRMLNSMINKAGSFCDNYNQRLL